MAAVKTDYYEVLGVARDADEETIRRAFHTLARDCHPDVSVAPEDQRRFRELAEAYRVLSKPASRLLYDRYGYRGRGNQGFDEGLRESGERPPRGENVQVRVVLQAYEARDGTRRLVRYEAPSPCPACDGWGVSGDPVPNCPECGGTGQVRLDACPECGVETCHECEGVGVVVAERRLRVRIPAGIGDGSQVRVAGEGGDRGPDGIPGDLLLDIELQPEPRDLALVRWLALAGLIAAVALLVAYLLLR